MTETNVKFKVAALSLGEGHREGEACAHFNEEGMEGSPHKNPERPVSLMSLSARQEVDRATLRGLCFRRFKADITLDCSRMPDKGATITANQLSLFILPEGKTCWPDCQLYQENLPCPLRQDVRFARVKTPGLLCVGDTFTPSDLAKYPQP